MEENNCKRQKKVINLEDLYYRHGVYDKLRKYYEEQIKLEYKLDNFIPELMMNGYTKEVYEEDELEEGKEVKCLYLGSVLSIAPSGKYYTPFAHSNVSLKEGIKDEMFWEVFEEFLNDMDLWMENGEGDALDIFICGVFNKEILDEDEEDEN